MRGVARAGGASEGRRRPPPGPRPLAASAPHTVPLALHVGPTTLVLPLPPPAVASLRAGLADLLTTFKAKAAAERPAKWPSMEVTWTAADASAGGGVVRFEAFCNPNSAASPFDAKVLVTAKAGGGVSVATECPLAGLRADVDACDA